MPRILSLMPPQPEECHDAEGQFCDCRVLLILTVAPAASQTVTPIEFPGAAHTRPHGINSSGEISGIYVNPDNSVHSFLLDRKGFTTIDVPGAIGTNALRINPQGEIVGFYVPSSGTGRGFLWRRGTFSDIALPGTVLDFGNGINARGDVVGQYNDTPGIPQHGYRSEPQRFRGDRCSRRGPLHRVRHQRAWRHRRGLRRSGRNDAPVSPLLGCVHNHRCARSARNARNRDGGLTCRDQCEG